MTKILLIAFTILNLHAEEVLKVPSVPTSKEINENLSSPKQTCDSCLNEKKKEQKNSDKYFERFNCKATGTFEEEYLKNWQLLGKTLEEYKQEFMMAEGDGEITSKKEIADAFDMIGDVGFWWDCRRPKMLSSFKKFSNDFPDRNFETCTCPISKENILVNCGAKKNKTISAAITVFEKISIELWSMSGIYQKINAALRNDNYQKICEMMPVAKEIMNGMAKLPGYNRTVFRGGGLPLAIDKKHLPGEIVEYAGFTSTSTDIEVANKFKGTGWLFTIDLKKSCHDIQSLSQGEAEILCPPGIKFKVLDRDDVKKEMHLEEVVP